MKRKYVVSLLIIFSLVVGGAAVADLSGDGMSSYKDVLNGTNPFQQDTDGDGLSDRDEIEIYGTNPSESDTDGDGLSDYKEVTEYETDPMERDSDEDGLSDENEIRIHNTNPTDSDTDSDGLDDKIEITQTDTNPSKSDTDEDGLEDGPEVNEYDTEPTNEDTDGDGLLDGEEVREYNTDPLSKDSDEDSLNDYEEINEYDTEPNNEDTDGDSLLDGEEVREYNTDPTEFDTDGDNISDSQEIKRGTDPLEKDSDNDLLNDGEEVKIGTDPLEPDTSGDGFIDGVASKNLAIEPLRYNVVIQVSYMEGVNVPEEELQIMKETFEESPTVSNNGKEGINFTILIDDNPVDSKQEISLEKYKNTYYKSAFNEGNGKYHVLMVNNVKSDNRSLGGVTSTDIDGVLVADLDSPEEKTHATMHELGHQLGLTPRIYTGVDSRDYSWDEYPSVMNYNRPNPWVYTYSREKGHNDWKFIEDYLHRNQASSDELVEQYSEGN